MFEQRKQKREEERQRKEAEEKQRNTDTYRGFWYLFVES